MQRINQTTVNNFVKGLITEAGELTFPEGASVDELNCTLGRDGSRSRRQGFSFESAYELSSFTVDPDQVITSGVWSNVAGIPGYNLIPIQVGSTIYFYKSGTAPYSANAQTFSIDLNDYQASPSVSVANAICQFTTVSGALVVASEAMDTIVCKYNSATDDLTIDIITFKIRDFTWRTTAAERILDMPAAYASTNRKYDTYNAGWHGSSKADDALEDFVGSTSVINATDTFGIDLGYLELSNELQNLFNLIRGVAYSGKAWPRLTHPWYSGKDSSGDFKVSEWRKIYTGSSITANGHFILNFLEQDRSTVSGLPGIATEYEYSRFKTVATYAGRIFYAGLSSSTNSNKILYSRLITDITGVNILDDLGACYQQNDPTSEDISDLLDTDGGVIVIPEAENIKKLHQFGANLYVFADNGIWIIGGIDDKFTPTGYFVSKLSNTGLYNVDSFVNAEGIPFWWSKYGIHSLSFSENGTPNDENISLNTIQSFWSDIGVYSKDRVRAAYDPVNKRIFWSYPTEGDERSNCRSDILILDAALQAFYPWRIEQGDYRPVMFIYFDGYDSEYVEEVVYDSSGGIITDSSLANVTIEVISSIVDADTQLVGIIYDEVNSKISFGTFSNDSFLDWGTTSFSSYAEAGYNFFGDLVLKKSAPYVTVYCRTTETGFSGNETDGYDTIGGSSLNMKAYWDFKTNPASSQEVYRIKPNPVVDSLDLSNNGQDRTVVTSRVKVRGSGRSMRLRFESTAEKDFVLLGYSVISGANARF